MQTQTLARDPLIPKTSFPYVISAPQPHSPLASLYPTTMSLVLGSSIYSETMDYPFYPYQISPPIFRQDVIVPQRPYAVNIQRNHVRTIDTVRYIVNGSVGISLKDAQAHNFRGLAHADDRPLDGFGVKVTYRIEWPGYGSFNRQKHALRATREKESVALSKMAIHVAEVLKDFIEEMEGVATTEPAWRVGPGYITLEDLYLLEIHQVAKASLQPVIAYRPRFWYP